LIKMYVIPHHYRAYLLSGDIRGVQSRWKL
jgi:hypothetical protein